MDFVHLPCIGFLFYERFNRLPQPWFISPISPAKLKAPYYSHLFHPGLQWSSVTWLIILKKRSLSGSAEKRTHSFLGGDVLAGCKASSLIFILKISFSPDSSGAASHKKILAAHLALLLKLVLCWRQKTRQRRLSLTGYRLLENPDVVNFE